MAIVARAGDGKFVPAPEGVKPAVCCDVVDLGLCPTHWGERHQVELRWQLEDVNSETHRRFEVRRRYGLTLHKKASLRRDLETWRSRTFTEPELAGFDLEKLLGVNCQVLVAHEPGDDGSVFANVMSVLPPDRTRPTLRVEQYTRVKDRPGYQEPRRPAAELTSDDIPF